MKGLAQENKVLTSTNSTVMSQLKQLTAAMGAMQAHLQEPLVITNNKN